MVVPVAADVNATCRLPNNPPIDWSAYRVSGSLRPAPGAPTAGTGGWPGNFDTEHHHWWPPL